MNINAEQAAITLALMATQLIVEDRQHRTLRYHSGGLLQPADAVAEARLILDHAAASLEARGISS